MNIFFIGSSGILSLQAFKFLLSSHHTVIGLGLSFNDGHTLNNIPLCDGQSMHNTVEGLAFSSGIPVINLYQFQQVAIEQLRCKQIDIIYVSCFSSRLPQEILSLPRFGSFNLHPSLLPAYRGPVPLFWQLRDGLSVIGVSLHRMTTEIDAGPIVDQENLTLEQGSDNDQITRDVAQIASRLIRHHLEAIETNKVVELPQDESLASTQPFPSEKDFIVNESWSNLRLYNFIRATQHWGNRYHYELDGLDYALTGEVSYKIAKNHEKIAKSVDNQEKVITIVSDIDVLMARFS